MLAIKENYSGRKNKVELKTRLGRTKNKHNKNKKRKRH